MRDPKSVNRQIEGDCVRLMLPCFLLHFIGEMLALTLPAVSSWMIGDMADALLQLDISQIQSRFVLFVLAFLLNVFVQPLVCLWENRLLTRLGFAYGNFLYGKFLHLPLKTAQSLDTAALVQRIDVDSTDYYFLLMKKYTRPCTMAIYCVLMAVFFALRQTDLLFLGTILLLAAVPLVRAGWNAKAKAAQKAARRRYEETREQMEYSLFRSRDFLRGFGIGKAHIRRMHRQYETYSAETGTRQDSLDGADAMFQYLCTYGIPLGIFAVGAIRMAAGTLEMGMLLAGFLILPTVTTFYRYAEGLVLQRQEEPVVRDKLVFLYEDPEQPGNVRTPRELRIQHLSFTWPQTAETPSKPVFQDLNCTIPLQGITHITGPNGCGKSTLLSLLAGLRPPDSGMVQDENGTPLTLGDLRASVALLAQDAPVFSGTVQDNLFLPPEKLPDAAAFLRDSGFNKPLDYPVSEAGGNLSPGERKKLTLARTLFQDAPILVLDEPLNHLDSQGTQSLTSFLTVQQKPILLVSHAGLEQLDPQGKLDIQALSLENTQDRPRYDSHFHG